MQNQYEIENKNKNMMSNSEEKLEKHLKTEIGMK